MRATIIVNVTQHALYRWRERVAHHGDANAADLKAAFREARRMPRNEPVPYVLYRSPDMDYYWHPGRAVVFVAEPLGRHEVRIVTVLTASTAAERGTARST